MGEGLVQGELFVDGEGLVTSPVKPNGDFYGILRLRYEDGWVVSNFKAPDGDAWSADTKAWSRGLARPSGRPPAPWESLRGKQTPAKPVIAVEGNRMRISWIIPLMFPA